MTIRLTLKKPCICLFSALAVVAFCLVPSAHAAEEKADATAKPSPKYDVVEPFNGTDLTGWKLNGTNTEISGLTVGTAKISETDPTKLTVTKSEEGKGDLVNAKAHGLDFYSEQKFGDAIYRIDFMVPKGSNSGIYIMGEYEVQILDSFGREKVGPGDVGGLYGAQAPKENASKAPGQWQTMFVLFEAPKFVDGKKVSNAKFVKVMLNGVTIHENVELPGVTPGGVDGKEKPVGPIMFQGNHGEVAFRKIRIGIEQKEEK